jgi:hypothetical protein
MQRRTPLKAALSAVALSALACAAPAQAQVKIAVTDLAYAQRVSEYFVAGAYQHSSQMSASAHASHGMYNGSASQSMQASEQSSGTFVAGRYSYIEQRELGGYSNDIKGALLQGTNFRLVQGKGFDAGKPQPTKAEQVLNQVQGGKMATPQAQPQVADVISRIKKGEFSGADYVLFGVVSSIDFTDALSPLQGTSSATRQYGLQLLTDFSLINTKTYEIKAAFSAQGQGNDTKILSARGDIAPPNRAKVMRETSQSLAQDVFQQLTQQLGYSAPSMVNGVRPAMVPAPLQAMPGQPAPQPAEQVMILK